MSAAPAPPAADARGGSDADARPALSAPPVLPAALAAELDARGAVEFLHPTTGVPVRLIPAGEAFDGDEPVPSPAERAEIDGHRTDLGAVRQGLAEANAGRLMSPSRFREAMAARHPRLR